MTRRNADEFRRAIAVLQAAATRIESTGKPLDVEGLRRTNRPREQTSARLAKYRQRLKEARDELGDYQAREQELNNRIKVLWEEREAQTEELVAAIKETRSVESRVDRLVEELNGERLLKEKLQREVTRLRHRFEQGEGADL